MKERVLLIAGGGTIGGYVTESLLAKGCFADVICLEERVSADERLCYHQHPATLPFLTSFLEGRHYDAIVNFLHYETVEDYRPYHALLSAHTEQLVFLSSYRVYSDLVHPVTEDAPLLTEVLGDSYFYSTEPYALSKIRCEQFLQAESKTPNWTIVRPVISFAGKRFDLLMYNNVLEEAQKGMPILLPEGARHLTAGLDWAGNVGRLIADLLFKKEALGEVYTVASGQNLTWETVASYYTELAGIEFLWIPTEAYIAKEQEKNYARLLHDRLYDRNMDCTKIMTATGYTPSDFVPIKEGIRIEMQKRSASINAAHPKTASASKGLQNCKNDRRIKL